MILQKQARDPSVELILRSYPRVWDCNEASTRTYQSQKLHRKRKCSAENPSFCVPVSFSSFAVSCAVVCTFVVLQASAQLNTLWKIYGRLYHGQWPIKIKILDVYIDIQSGHINITDKASTRCNSQRMRVFKAENFQELRVATKFGLKPGSSSLSAFLLEEEKKKHWKTKY